MPKRLTPWTRPRLTPVFAAYAKARIAALEATGLTQTEIGKQCGAAQSTISQHSTGTRDTTLEMVEKLAAASKQSGSQLLTSLQHEALELDKVSPGWDRLPAVEQVPVDELIDRASRQSDVGRVRDRPKRSGKRQK